MSQRNTIKEKEVTILKFSYVRRLLLLLLVHSAAASQVLCADVLPDDHSPSVSLRVENQSPTSHWHIRLASNGDTIFSSPLTSDLLLIELNRHRSYHVTFFMEDGPYSKDYYINGFLHNEPVVRFTCGSETVQTADPLVEQHSAEVRRFSLGVWPTTTKVRTPPKVFELLNNQLASVETTLLGAYRSTEEKCYVRDSVIGPVRKYLDSLQTRIEAFRRNETHQPISVKILESESNAIGWSAPPLSKATLSNEAYMMIRGVAYAMSYRLPTWFDSNTIASNTVLTVDIARSVLGLVGESCACEAAYGLFQRSSTTPGANFTSCTDSLPIYLLHLARSDSAYFCGRLKIDLKALCGALSTSTVDSFVALRSDSLVVNRIIDDDSTYLLHFWGTWCTPCVEGYDLVESTADTLELLGCKTLHIACENKDRFPIWKEFIKKRGGEQLFTCKTLGNHKMLADQLAISSFPTLMVIRRGGEILARDIAIEKVTDLVRRVASD